MIGRLNMLLALRRDRRGVTALEYGLIAAAVVAVGLAGFNIVGFQVATKVLCVSSTLADTPLDIAGVCGVPLN
jgi:Flp pilus assembly pilin Flp